MYRRNIAGCLVVVVGAMLVSGSTSRGDTPHAIATADTTVQITVSEGWNLISLPVSVPDGRVSVLFPTASSRAFYYQGRYIKTDTLRPLVGYWLKFATAETIVVNGEAWYRCSFPVKRGWNLIGSLPDTVLASHIYARAPATITSRFYDYRSEVSTYALADTLVPGRGYWVKTSDSTVLETYFGRGGRVRLQNEVEHSGIFVFLTDKDTIDPSDIAIMTATDSLGYFMFDSLPDGNWKLVALYPYYNGNVLPISIVNGLSTNEIDLELQQFFQFWMEPADTTVSLQDSFCIYLWQYSVNLWSDTIMTSSSEDCRQTIFGWIPGSGWPTDSCTAFHWRFYNDFCHLVVYQEFAPGDTVKKHEWTICKESFDDGPCFPDGVVGTYLLFSAPTDASVYPWFLDRRYLLDGYGDPNRVFYRGLNRSLSKKLNLFRPTRIHVVN